MLSLGTTRTVGMGGPEAPGPELGVLAVAATPLLAPGVDELAGVGRLAGPLSEDAFGLIGVSRCESLLTINDISNLARQKSISVAPACDVGGSLPSTCRSASLMLSGSLVSLANERAVTVEPVISPIRPS